MDFRTEIAAALSASAKTPAAELFAMLENPPNPEMGDYALPCFKLAKSMKKAPPAIAEQLKGESVFPGFVSRVEVAGGYLNFFIDRAVFVREALSPVLALGASFGSSNEGGGRAVCIDYSSINIAKPFHIGHLSSTVIGHALYNIFNFLGYKAVGINHLGDWGTQFGKLIVAFRRWGSKEEIENGGVRAMLEIYARFHDEAEQDGSLNDEARAAFKAIEDGEPDALALFDWFRTLTLKEVQRVYDLLGVEFDSYAGESFYNDKMQPVVDELRAKGLLELDDGASVVRFPEEDSMPPCLILRSDGATLYATRDIAAAFYRKNTYDFAKSLYVVAYQQNLHFRQVFKVIEMMGCPWAKDLVHVAFGMVSTADGTLSTRKGKVVFLEDVLKESIEKTRAIMMEKSPDLPGMEKIAQEVGVGALVFSTLSAARIKDIVFDWDRALNFEGETGPYCQYTHARCCSLLARAGYDPGAGVDYSLITDPESVEVARLLHEFPAAVKAACEKYEPFIITRFVVDLAQAFNRFYLAHRILGEPQNVQNARLALTACARRVIATGLTLLGIAAPEKM